MEINSIENHNLKSCNESIDIQAWLITWFVEKKGIAVLECRSKLNGSYFDEGWLDSFAFISFILDIETFFNIKFSNDEFQKVEFSTITGLTKIIQESLYESKH